MIMRSLKKRLALVPLVLLCATPCWAQAATPPDAGDAAGAPAVLDPTAVAALESMGTALRTLDSFTVRSTSSVDVVLDTGQKIQLDQRITYQANRPDGLYVELESDRRHRRLYYDGAALTLYSPRLGYYATVPTHARSLDELVTSASRDYGIALPLADLFYWGTPDLPMTALTSAISIGPATIAGVMTEQYAFRQPGVDWQLWIAADTRLPQKIVITSLDDPSHPEFRAELAWDTRTPVPASASRFTPPDDAAAILLAHPDTSGDTTQGASR